MHSRGGNPKHGDPGGSNVHILTKNYPKYSYYSNNFTFRPFDNAKFHHVLSWIYICGYFTCLHYQMLQIVLIISIFGIILGQNEGIWPQGVSMYMGYLPLFCNSFEEIPSCFGLNVYVWLLCIIKWSKGEAIWIIRIFGVIFCQNVGIWPPGSPCIGLRTLLCN